MALSRTDMMIGKLESVVKRYETLTQQLSDPQGYAQTPERIRLAKERRDCEEIVQQYDDYRAILRQIKESDDVLRDATAEAELKELAREECDALEKKREARVLAIQSLLMPRHPDDHRNIFLEIRAGTGGGEAALFAADLLKMYTKYAELQGWKPEMITASSTEIGGIRDVVLSIAGKGVYRSLRHESGVHRVQRVPETETSGRIHTSTVTVAVIPEVEEVEIQIDQKDLRIDTFCASSAGGQSVNTTYSAVRITHLPTGVVVSCQDERSQLKNRNKGMRVLRSRLFEIEKAKRDAEIAKNRKSQVGTGDRSEKIRTYNFKENRVTDHRINLSLYQLPQILNGDLSPFIQKLVAREDEERLQQGQEERPVGH